MDESRAFGTCCICSVPTLQHRYRLCTTHWAAYGGTKETRAPWVRLLLAEAAREQYYTEVIVPRMFVSLERITADGFALDNKELYRSVGTRVRRRHTPGARRRQSKPVEVF